MPISNPAAAAEAELIAGCLLPAYKTKKASDDLRHSSDGIANTSSLNIYVLLKTLTLTNGIKGTLRTKFSIYSNSGGTYYVYGKIYKNGVAVGTEQSAPNSTPVLKTEDIDFGVIPAGGTIELWGHMADVSIICYVKEFRLYYEDDFPAGVAVT